LHLNLHNVRRQAQAVPVHRRCADGFTTAQIAECAPSHSHLTNIDRESVHQEVLVIASAFLFLHEQLFFEEHPQEALVGGATKRPEEHSVQGHPDRALRDTDREPRRVLRQAH